MTIVASLGEFTIPYGVLNLNKKGELGKIEEKPSSSHLVNTIYVLSPNVIELIPSKKYFDMTDLIKTIKSNKGSIGVYPIHEGEWSDVGEWDEFHKTEENYLLKNNKILAIIPARSGSKRLQNKNIMNFAVNL